MTSLISATALLNDIGAQALSLGTCGLLFVMWWHERQERLRTAAQTADALEQTRRLSALNGQLLEVIRSNTEALVALRAEIRSQREALAEWTERLMDRMEGLRRAS